MSISEAQPKKRSWSRFGVGQESADHKLSIRANKNFLESPYKCIYAKPWCTQEIRLGIFFQPFFQLNPALILQSVKLAALGSISQEPVRTIYVDYNHRPTKLHGTLIVNLVSKCRELNRANLLVSEKRKRCLLELDLQTFAKLKELSVEGDLESIRWKKYISSRSLPI